MLEPIRIRTVADMVEHAHELGVFCPGCLRWATVDLKAMVVAGQGSRRLDRLRLRCRDCGGIGKVQTRPPTPFVDGYPADR